MKREKPKFQVGDIVAVRSRGLPHARIVRFQRDIAGGVVIDRSVNGFRIWNISDLKKVGPRPRKEMKK
jgi:hypothetical protein